MSHGFAVSTPRTFWPIPRRLPIGAPTDDASGTLGDLAPHMINCALALLGPIESVMGDFETVHKTRGGVTVNNDDHAQMMCRFQPRGTMGHLYFSRIATGRKMGYAYEIHGTKGRDPLRSGRPERALAL
jgi:predicted dehydrogenase